MKIIINSYTCCPGMGSEQGMGWNWITSLAKTGDVELFVISEGEYRKQIEDWIACERRNEKKLNDSVHWTDRIHWYWNPVPQSTRDKCWNQGNWSFYLLYKEWQKKTAEIARQIIVEQKGDCAQNGNCSNVEKRGIDVLHQLNMIGFREPGYLAEVSKDTGIPLVWGPIGGLKLYPVAYAERGILQFKLFSWLKNMITSWQIKNDRRVVDTLKHAKLLISSIPDSYSAIKKYHNLDSFIIPETGCFVDDFLINHPVTVNNNPKLTLLWVGKFDFRKRLDIAFKSLAMVGNPMLELKVFGSGSEQQVEDAKMMVKDLGIESMVQFMGTRTNDEVMAEMRKADAFLFTSVNEDTSTVVLEAVSNLLPVICFDCCGMAAVIDDKVGVKIPLTNPNQSVKDFAEAIERINNDRELLAQMSENCKERAMELSWENKAKKMVELYKKSLHKS